MSETRHKKNAQPMADTLAEARTGLFRATLLFGSIAAALSLIAVPAADRHAKYEISQRERSPETVDPIVTGTNPSPGEPRRYVVRQSVLDDARSGPCLLFPDGTQRGAC